MKMKDLHVYAFVVKTLILGYDLRYCFEEHQKNVTNLHIYCTKTIALHALHVHFSLLSVSLPSSTKQQREIAKFGVL